MSDLTFNHIKEHFEGVIMDSLNMVQKRVVEDMSKEKQQHFFKRCILTGIEPNTHYNSEKRNGYEILVKTLMKIDEIQDELHEEILGYSENGPTYISLCEMFDPQREAVLKTFHMNRTTIENVFSMMTSYPESEVGTEGFKTK